MPVARHAASASAARRRWITPALALVFRRETWQPTTARRRGALGGWAIVTPLPPVTAACRFGLPFGVGRMADTGIIWR